jgi:hypothetical protein
MRRKRAPLIAAAAACVAVGVVMGIAAMVGAFGRGASGPAPNPGITLMAQGIREGNERRVTQESQGHTLWWEVDTRAALITARKRNGTVDS